MSQQSRSNTVKYSRLIGDPGFKPADIVKKIEKNDIASGILFYDFDKLARELDVPILERQQMEADRMQNKCDHMRIVERILIDWKKRHPSEATIENLITVFAELDMNNVADVLKDMKSRDYSRDVTPVQVAVFVAVAIAIFIVTKFYIAANNETKDVNMHKTPETPNLDSDLSKSIALIPEASNLSVSTYEEYERKIQNIKICCVHLNVTINKSSDWKTDTKMKNSNNVRSLAISGTITKSIFLNILRQTSEINTLYVSNHNGTFCETFNDQTDHPILVNTFHVPEMYKLDSIILMDLKECESFYKTFYAIVQGKAFQSIKFINCLFSNDNIEFIQNIIHRSEKTLEFLDISGVSNTKQRFYTPGNNLFLIKAVIFNMESKQSIRQANMQQSFFDIHFCHALPNLEDFQNSVGLSYLDVLVILKCPNLKSLTATVIFNQDDEFFNMNAGIVSDQITFIQLAFNFTSTCPSKEQVKQLGLHEISKTIVKKFSSSCSLATEHSSSDEVPIVEFYSKTAKQQIENIVLQN